HALDERTRRAVLERISGAGRREHSRYGATGGMKKAGSMGTMAVYLEIDADRVTAALQDAEEKLDSAESEMVVEFSSVRRVDAAVLQALVRLATGAEAKGVKILLRGVNTDVYKALKLVELASRFSFVN
ncbi:MAG TPA: STAS domain-containing protein, partial [Candidatus Angelobacter sp.]|nr:STAS domain-containing protein [Candidatus Angelobacter sp.]